MSFLQNPLIAEKVLNLAINSVVILLLAWLLVRLARHKTAPIRSGIILTAILILLLLPILNSKSLTMLFPSFTTVLPISLSDSFHPADAIMNQTSKITQNPRLAPHSSKTLTKNLAQKIQLLLTSYQSRSLFIKTINSLGIIWIIGSFFLVIKLLYGMLSLKKFKKSLDEIHDQRILKILETAERSFTNHPRTAVLTSRQIFSPLAIGTFKPQIILPHGIHAKLNDSEIRGILIHELSHIYHKDQISGILQRVVSALHWWNPIVYTLSAELSRAREEISDNHVLLENDKKEYAECLINLAEWTSITRRLPVFSGMASPHFPLRDRVMNILSKERTMETRLSKSTIGLIALISLFIIGAIAGHRLTFAAVKANEATESLAEITVKPTKEVKLEDAENIKAEPTFQESKEKADKEKDQERKIVKPKLMKKVDPVYPSEAREAGIEGIVTIEGMTDKTGKVIKTKILRGEHEILNNAAVAAVEQWVYKPFIINGKPIGIEFTVTLSFNLAEKDKAKTTSETTAAGANVDVITLPDDVELKLIKRVEPEYPREALKKLIGGKVVLEALIDKKGNVVDAKVIESEHEILNDAAIAAVKQWEYEPYKKNGIPKKVRYKVTLNFKVR